MDYFLQPSENRAWRWAATIVKRYMEQSQMNSKIQLDDREVRGEDSLQYTATLSASELHSYLRDNTFQVEHSNTHRRLISICNLDTNTIRTLAETALWHQQDCLRDAFWKHISFETSIKMVEAFGGFKTPHIEFHLPYLALRTVSSASATDRSNDASMMEWEDVTFLNHEKPIDRDLIYQAQISIVVCVWDQFRWTGYRFFNPPPNNPDDSSGDESDNAKEDESDGEDDFIPRVDIFAPDDIEDVMSDDPIWDPRTYFLRIAAVWISCLLNEYTNVIRTLEERIKARVS